MLPKQRQQRSSGETSDRRNRQFSAAFEPYFQFPAALRQSKHVTSEVSIALFFWLSALSSPRQNLRIRQFVVATGVLFFRSRGCSRRALRRRSGGTGAGTSASPLSSAAALPGRRSPPASSRLYRSRSWPTSMAGRLAPSHRCSRRSPSSCPPPSSSQAARAGAKAAGCCSRGLF